MIATTQILRADVRYTREAVLKTINDLNKKGNPYSVLVISNTMQCGVATVYRHIRALERHGYIKTIAPGDGYTTNRYELTNAGVSKL